MLKINPIKNVNNTLNTISFQSGKQTNYGVHVAPHGKSVVENSFLTGFSGVVEKTINKISEKVRSRAKSIEKGLEETKKLNKVA